MAIVARLLVAGILAASFPATAGAGWSRPQRGSEFALPPGAPVPAVRLVHGTGPIRVKARGDRTRAIPGSRRASATIAAARGGLVAVAWQEPTACTEGVKGTCDERVMASVWRPGERPPPGTALESGPDLPDPSSVAVGRDGTVLVAWTLVFDEYDDEPVGVEAAVGRGTAPLRHVAVAGAIPRLRAQSPR